MCRKLLFSGIVVLAVSSALCASAPASSWGQGSFLIGGESTYASQGGKVGFDGDGSFVTGGQLEYKACGPCTSVKMTETNSGYIDQGAAVGGCGGCRTAGNFMLGGGVQCQGTTYDGPSNNESSNCSPCFPTSHQFQAIGGIGTNHAVNTCGVGGAQANQAGGASEFQNITTPVNSGMQFQHIAGVQSGVANGMPTSYASAGGTIAGGGMQSQSFGGLAIQ